MPVPAAVRLQINARGEAEIYPLGERHRLRDIDDPVEFFRRRRHDLTAEGLAAPGLLYGFVAVDTTHNCNLRCTFCIDDFAQATRDRMTEEDFVKAIALGELTWPGGLFLSCLYEPFLHPRFLDLLQLVPSFGREKAFFTTNLSVKRLKPAEVEALAAASVGHINVSVDSMTRETYEKVRVNADYDVFWENLNLLAATFRRSSGAPHLRFISMALRSNYDEIPEMARAAHERFGVAQHEIRLPLDTVYAPADWIREESLTAQEWALLEDRLAALPYPMKVMVSWSTSRYHPAPVPGLHA